jgi:hypothetical protein
MYQDDQEKRLLLDLDSSLSDAEPSSSEGILNFFDVFFMPHVLALIGESDE